jgi:hypothetical protein
LPSKQHEYSAADDLTVSTATASSAHYPCTDDYALHIRHLLLQVKSGTIFDDIIVTDSLEEAQALANEGWATWKDAEKAVEDEISTKVNSLFTCYNSCLMY